MNEEFVNTDELSRISLGETVEIMGGMGSAEARSVNIDDIYLDPEHLPKEYRTEELAALAIDILENGLRDPMVVTPLKGCIKGGFKLISGEKRFRACLLARMDSAPCIVVWSDGDVETPVWENYFAKAEKYAELIEKDAICEEKLAENENITLEELYSMLSLLVFDKNEQKLLLDSCIPEHIALKLAAMDANTRRGFMETILHGTNAAAVCAKISETSAEESGKDGAHFQKTKFRIRGNGFFLNSIHRAVETMREGGINVSLSAEETDDGTVLRLIVPRA